MATKARKTSAPASESKALQSLGSASAEEQPQTLLRQYLGLGPERSIAALAKLVHIPQSELEEERQAEDWDLMAADYDRAQMGAQHRRTLARTAQEWEARSQQQLAMASLLRKKAYEYLQHREVDGAVTEDGHWLIKPIETQKGLLVLKMLDHANQTERLLLGQPTDRIEHQGEVFSTERLHVIMQESVNSNRSWRAKKGLPALDGPDDPLEGYSSSAGTVIEAADVRKSS